MLLWVSDRRRLASSTLIADHPSVFPGGWFSSALQAVSNLQGFIPVTRIACVPSAPSIYSSSSAWNAALYSIWAQGNGIPEQTSNDNDDDDDGDDDANPSDYRLMMLEVSTIALRKSVLKTCTTLGLFWISCGYPSIPVRHFSRT
jgi:hypothetical protein